MASKLTDHEQAAITDALDAGKVRIIPPGVSGVPVEGFHWRDYMSAGQRRYLHVGRIKRLIDRERGLEGQS